MAGTITINGTVYTAEFSIEQDGYTIHFNRTIGFFNEDLLPGIALDRLPRYLSLVKDVTDGDMELVIRVPRNIDRRTDSDAGIYVVQKEQGVYYYRGTRQGPVDVRNNYLLAYSEETWAYVCEALEEMLHLQGKMVAAQRSFEQTVDALLVSGNGVGSWN